MEQQRRQLIGPVVDEVHIAAIDELEAASGNQSLRIGHPLQ
jgi:hypothetical protein